MAKTATGAGHWRPAFSTASLVLQFSSSGILYLLVKNTCTSSEEYVEKYHLGCARDLQLSKQRLLDLYLSSVGCWHG